MVIDKNKMIEYALSKIELCFIAFGTPHAWLWGAVRVAVAS